MKRSWRLWLAAAGLALGLPLLARDGPPDDVPADEPDLYALGRSDGDAAKQRDVQAGPCPQTWRHGIPSKQSRRPARPPGGRTPGLYREAPRPLDLPP